tara:strand:- start:72 stop:497 length:426 start_codon:yes stop_codon:yes gene_type:complete
MTPESKVKRAVTKHLKNMGAYYFYPVTGGYGKSGVPDIVGCYKGRFFGLECKAGSNKPTALQQKSLRDIAESGGISSVINELNVDAVPLILQGEQNYVDGYFAGEQLTLDFGDAEDAIEHDNAQDEPETIDWTRRDCEECD